MKSNTHMTFERDAISSYLVIQSDATRVIQEYEVEMLRRNPIDSFLDLHILAINGEKKLYYNITSKQQLVTTLERKQLSYLDMCNFFNALITIVKDCNKYFLSSLKINLERHTIYVSPHDFQPKFVYIPYEDEANSIQEDLRGLIELFFDKVNQEDIQGVMMVHRLLTASKKDDFGLGQIEEILYQDQGEEEQVNQHLNTSQSIGKEHGGTIEENALQGLHKSMETSSRHPQNASMKHNQGTDQPVKPDGNNAKKERTPSSYGLQKNLKENEDGQVIDQLIKRNKQRQAMAGNEPSSQTNAFRQNKKLQDKWKKEKKRLGKIGHKTNHSEQSEKNKQAEQNKKSFFKKVTAHETSKKQGLPLHYIGIGCIQVLVIILFLLLLKKDILHSDVDGSLRLDALLASIAMLMALNLYGSKKILDYWQAKQLKAKVARQPSINMHKQEVYNQPPQSTPQQVRTKKQLKEKRIPSLDEQAMNQSISMERDRVIGMHEQHVSKHVNDNHIQYKEQLFNRQPSMASPTDSEDTALLDTATHGGAMETKPSLIRKDGDMVDKISLGRNPFIIGKLKNQVDYVIDNSSVSRIHCKIIEKEENYYIVDLNSKNGTYLDGEPLDSNKEYPLYDGSQIGISNCHYAFEIGRTM